MKILVCISRTPETTAPVVFSSDGSYLEEQGVNYIMNPYDEWYALTRGVEIAEQLGGELVVINVGDESNTPILQKALAIGADRSVRIDVNPKSALHVANEIANYARTQEFDLIITGKETIDHSSALVGGMVAELLNWDFESFINKLEVDDGKAVVHREVEGGFEKVEISLPLVLSATKGLGEQKIPNMRGIMMAKKKPQEIIPSSSQAGNDTVTGFERKSEKGGVTMIDPENVEELVRLLREEAKAI